VLPNLFFTNSKPLTQLTVKNNIESIKSLDPNINRKTLTTLLKVKKGAIFLKSNSPTPPHTKRDAKSIRNRRTQA
jgi:hypothetical protein